MTDKLEALRRTKLFSDLPQDALRDLAEHAVERRLRRGETLFVAGEEARGLYVIVRGAIRAYRESLSGREQTVHVERAGSTIAEVPVFDDGPHPSNAVAEEDTLVLFIDKRDVKKLCREHPCIALGALKAMAGRLRHTAALIERLSLRGVDQRLAAFLLEEAERYGVRTARGLSVELRLTNQEIAARIGTVREVVSRALARLQRESLIELKGRRLTVLDERGLALRAESFIVRQA
ncbi:MAG: Crp/Fnr family transcriptional regulator [Pyrinomonas sp.]|uniref:Crp/Fnr family transcriptional regulator n=1 Tax=Pyrinomonas sp. TaxID=2080306 RepID=UPI00332AAC87